MNLQFEEYGMIRCAPTCDARQDDDSRVTECDREDEQANAYHYHYLPKIDSRNWTIYILAVHICNHTAPMS